LKLGSCSIGTHFISIPLKVVAFKNGKTVTYIAKIVTKKLNMLNTIVAMKSICFKTLVDVQDTFCERLESA
jgi:hypothetical protein